IDGASKPGHDGSTSTLQSFAVPVSAPPAQAAGGWTLGRFSSFPAQQLPAAVLDGRIWLAGGLTSGEQATNRTEHYDPTIHQWGPGPNLPFPVHHAMMVNYRGQLWLIGGFIPKGSNLEAAASARVLILKNGRWEDGPALHHARAAGAAAVVGDKIVVVGGGTGVQTARGGPVRPGYSPTRRAGRPSPS